MWIAVAAANKGSTIEIGPHPQWQLLMFTRIFYIRIRALICFPPLDVCQFNPLQAALRIKCDAARRLNEGGCPMDQAGICCIVLKQCQCCDDDEGGGDDDDVVQVGDNRGGELK